MKNDPTPIVSDVSRPGLEDNGGPDRGPGAGGGLVIRAPRGPVLVRPGYAIYAARFTVDEDGIPDVLDAVVLDGHVDSAMRAQARSRGYALQPERYGILGMDAVIVNDHAGNTVLRRDLQPAA